MAIEFRQDEPSARRRHAAIQRRRAFGPTQPRAEGAGLRPAGRLPPEIAFLSQYGVSLNTLLAAAGEAEQAGVTAEIALTAGGRLPAETYYRLLARHLRKPFAGPGLALSDSLDVNRAIRSGVAPLKPNIEGLRALLAPRGEAVRDLIARASEGRLSGRSFAICDPQRFAALARARAGTAIAEDAANGLAKIDRSLSARSGASVTQLCLLLVASVAAIVCAVAAPVAFDVFLFASLWLLFAATIALRSVASGAGASGTAPPDLDDFDLPIYSILVPLYREAEVVPGLVSALDALDYPRVKLDIKLIVETNDRETLAAIARLRLPACYDVVVAPPGEPRTKPRALNIALASARGDLTVIYDAEDTPDPEQLRLAARHFAADSGLDCLQARLAIENYGSSLLTKCFALEYATLFDFLNPGLLALQLPIGLGGTSNHFRTRVLRSIGGWDAWNVAEDADLGVRLARFGRRVGALSSDTYEEAPESLWMWFRQRSRWKKGWMQTIVTHCRRPRRLVSDLGWVRTASLGALMVGGVVGSLTWPILAFSLLLHALYGLPKDGLSVLSDIFTYVLALAGAQSVIAPMVAAMRLRGLKNCRSALLFLPVYYCLICVASWAALYELVRRPFHWAKTQHRARGEAAAA